MAKLWGKNEEGKDRIREVVGAYIVSTVDTGKVEHGQRIFTTGIRAHSKKRHDYTEIAESPSQTAAEITHDVAVLTLQAVQGGA